ncbi:MAG: hypothetical protein ACI9MC_003629, partial [Kiritimatiellia bacterium]
EVAFRWSDPEYDGDPAIDNVVLSNALDYDLQVSFLNELSDISVDITAEVQKESDEHQLFVTGTAVNGPATTGNVDAVVDHAYADVDGNGFPVGLVSSISPRTTGTGTFVVTLRHLPPENGAATKTGTLADDLASGGFEALPGDTDAQVTFDLTVE